MGFIEFLFIGFKGFVFVIRLAKLGRSSDVVCRIFG